MKKLLIIIAAILLAPSAKAVTLVAAQSVKVIVPWATVCSSAAITNTAADVTGNSATVPKYYAAAVANTDTTANVCCSSDPNVTTSTGFCIGPSAANTTYQFIEWTINPTQKWYCISSVASSKAILCNSQ